jgi:hypothetical protein
MTKTVIYDIEAASAVTATAQELLKYQVDAINKMAGFKSSDFITYTAARSTGKSMYMKMLKNRIYDTNPCKEIFLPMYPPEPKYKFSRAKWYEAKINGDGVWRLTEEYNQIIDWCTEQFGKHPAPPDAWSRWYVGVGKIYFRDAQDYEWYMLKWAQ